MDINNTNIGQKFYFIDKIYSNDTAVIECGVLKSMLPKWNFQDSFGSTYKREENILFNTATISGKEISKVVTNNGLIFDKLSDAILYCQSNDIDVLFGYSVVLQEGRNDN